MSDELYWRIEDLKSLINRLDGRDPVSALEREQLQRELEELLNRRSSSPRATPTDSARVESRISEVLRRTPPDSPLRAQLQVELVRARLTRNDGVSAISSVLVEAEALGELFRAKGVKSDPEKVRRLTERMSGIQAEVSELIPPLTAMKVEQELCGTDCTLSPDKLNWHQERISDLVGTYNRMRVVRYAHAEGSCGLGPDLDLRADERKVRDVLQTRLEELRGAIVGHQETFILLTPTNKEWHLHRIQQLKRSLSKLEAYLAS